MCGRFLLDSEIRDILEKYNISDNELFNYNKGEIFPTTTVPVVYGSIKTEVSGFVWGFQFKGAKTPVINARAETIDEKPAFRDSFTNRRCIIPVNAFYEWKSDDGKKEKHIIRHQSDKLFSLGAIYKSFIDEENKKYNAFVIVTVEANDDMKKIHSRMPLIIEKGLEDKWLKSSDLYEVKALMTTAKRNGIVISPVFTKKHEQLGLY